MCDDRNKKFQEHSIFLSEIAGHILAKNSGVLKVPGISEIIALYLLIPYITNDQLDAGMPSKMPKLNINDEFLDGISLRNLRDTICHSFVTVDESTSERFGRIIIDDRAFMNRSAHNGLREKTKNINLEVTAVNRRLIELHNQVTKYFDEQCN